MCFLCLLMISMTLGMTYATNSPAVTMKLPRSKFCYPGICLVISNIDLLESFSTFPSFY